MNRSFSSGGLRKACRQRGAVLIAALVCLLIVTSMLGSMLQGTLRARRQLHVQRDLRQTELLLDAGVDRAVLRLSTEPEYRGEKWALPAESIVGKGDGRVTMKVSRDSSAAPWQIEVMAEYPVGGELSIRRSRTFLAQSQLTQTQE